MATLSDLRTDLALALRDSSNNVFSTGELDDLINEGIDKVGDVYPREIVSTFATITAGVYSYAASSFGSIYRIDIYTTSNSYRTTLEHGYGAGPNSGWELHGGVVYLPPSLSFTAGDTLRAFGYARYTQLAASTSTTDLDQSGIFAALTLAQMKGYTRLMADRALFQQWQAAPGNTDVTLIQIAQALNTLRADWREEQRRLRRLRKTG